ncbi:MAG: class II aldolase [Rhizobiaceae bacterium]|nr:class II aldolase [Rhizobiaceae bacterium]
MDSNSEAEFGALRALSARIGADPALVQAAGGNTSLKIGDTLWIKASGTWLMNAMRDEIMVPVSLPPLLKAVTDIDPSAERAEVYTIAEQNPRGLRPSIETTVHALMPQRVVVHVHCVETIAVAAQANARALLAERLHGMDWVFIPYCRPGLPLARAIAELRRADTDILILGNHGLVVAADTVEAAEKLLRRVSGLLARPPRQAPPPDIAALMRLAGTDYRLPLEAGAHAAGTDLTSCRIAAKGTLYPDHVIFLGEGSAVAGPDEQADDVAARARRDGKPLPTSIIFPGKGVLMRRDANAGAEALALCLADVTARIDAQAALHYLSAEDADQLINWDAEKYRQELTRRMGSTLR